MFLNPPEVPESAYPIQVQYACSEPSVVQLQGLVTFDTGTTVKIFHRWWHCVPGPLRIRRVLLHFPDWLVYHPDWSIQVSSWVLTCLLRGWVGRSAEPVQSSFASAVVPMTVQSPLSRPLKQHLLCLDWDTEMLWKVVRGRWQCPRENGED